METKTFISTKRLHDCVLNMDHVSLRLCLLKNNVFEEDENGKTALETAEDYLDYLKKDCCNQNSLIGLMKCIKILKKEEAESYRVYNSIDENTYNVMQKDDISLNKLLNLSAEAILQKYRF